MDLANIGDVVSAVGALGLASFALVDASKVGRSGGVSNSGFVFIERAVRALLPQERLNLASAASRGPGGVLDVLHASWINGAALADQKAIAKSLVKLRLTPETAEGFARATLVDAAALARIAGKMVRGERLETAEANALGRFDLALSAILDEGYQRADQKYRNSARALASLAAVVLAVFGGWAVSKSGAAAYFGGSDVWIAVLCGVLATPLAPISKDLTSALAAGVKLAQTLRK